MKRLKEICKVILVYFFVYVFSALAFVAMFHTPLLKSLHVLMYRGIVFVILSGIIGGIILAGIKHFGKENWITLKDGFIVFLYCCCINMVFFTLVPVTVERSISVFMLSYMENSQEVSFNKDRIEEVFIEKYIKEYEAFEKRFNEQIITGNIQKNNDGSYQITEQGKTIVWCFRFIADLFDTDKRLLYPELSVETEKGEIQTSYY